MADNHIGPAAAPAAQVGTQGQPGPGMGHQPPILAKITDKLNLTADQRGKIKTIMETNRPKMVKLMDQLVQNRQQLKAAVNSDNYSQAQVKQLAKAQGKLISHMIVLRADMHQQVLKVLTPAQKAQIKQFMHKALGPRGPHPTPAPGSAPAQAPANP